MLSRPRSSLLPLRAEEHPACGGGKDRTKRDPKIRSCGPFTPLALTARGMGLRPAITLCGCGFGRFYMHDRRGRRKSNFSLRRWDGELGVQALRKLRSLLAGPQALILRHFLAERFRQNIDIRLLQKVAGQLLATRCPLKLGDSFIRRPKVRIREGAKQKTFPILRRDRKRELCDYNKHHPEIPIIHRRFEYRIFPLGHRSFQDLPYRRSLLHWPVFIEAGVGNDPFVFSKFVRS